MDQLERCVNFLHVKIGPGSLGEIHLGASDLPEQEVGNS